MPSASIQATPSLTEGAVEVNVFDSKCGTRKYVRNGAAGPERPRQAVYGRNGSHWTLVQT